MGLLTESGDKREGALEHYARGGTGYIGAPWLEKNQVVVPEGGVRSRADGISPTGVLWGRSPRRASRRRAARLLRSIDGNRDTA